MLPDPGVEILPAVKATLTCARNATEYGADSAEISILLTDDAQVRQLNGRYRGADRPTNVLAFPGTNNVDLPVDIEAEPGPDQPAHMLGDIVLAFETVAAEANDQGKKFGDHLTHLIVHGLLHLLGFDHQQDEDAEQMEALEVEILANLGLVDPYAGESRSHPDD